ncbi:MAG: glycosyltransferase family 2 protein [Bacteroidales bacterium]
MQFKVAVVILNWNGSRYLKRFLPGVISHSQNNGTGIFVADNGSTDDSLLLLETSFKEVNVITLTQNYGFAEGYNRALRQINSEYFVLLNSDVEVTEGWLTPLVAFMDSHPAAAACAPKIRDFSRTSYFEYAGAAGGYIDRFGYPFCRGRVLSSVEVDQNQYNGAMQVFWASGACMFVRSSAYSRTGGLDNRFFAHMEEIDLCWRFINNGYTVWSIPESKVFHVGGGTLPNNNPRKLYLNYRNSLFMLHKNLHSTELFLVLFVRILLDWLSALAYLAGFKFNYAGSVCKAHCHYLKSITALNHCRHSSPFRKLREIPQVFPKSILFEFFVLKHKKFSQLGNQKSVLPE